jgi:hypothetical protein
VLSAVSATTIPGAVLNYGHHSVKGSINLLAAAEVTVMTMMTQLAKNLN